MTPGPLVFVKKDSVDIRAVTEYGAEPSPSDPCVTEVEDVKR